MTTQIDNNQRIFLVKGSGWNTQQFVCNLADVVKCAKEFEVNQPYNISHFWNGQFKKLSVKKVIELLEANQLDASFFKKKKPSQKELKEHRENMDEIGRLAAHG